MNAIEIYQTPEGATAIAVHFEQDTVWLTQAQLVELFGRDQSVISRHLRNVFQEGELTEQGNMQKMHIAGADKPVAFYSLDVIISIGYRVKSRQGTQFRQWATARLKEHLVRGYTLNEERLRLQQDNIRQLEHTPNTKRRQLCRDSGQYRTVVRRRVSLSQRRSPSSASVVSCASKIIRSRMVINASAHSCSSSFWSATATT